jgi:hypothetical protein
VAADVPAPAGSARSFDELRDAGAKLAEQCPAFGHTLGYGNDDDATRAVKIRRAILACECSLDHALLSRAIWKLWNREHGWDLATVGLDLDRSMPTSSTAPPDQPWSRTFPAFVQPTGSGH